MSEQLIKTKIKILRHLKRKKITIISHYHNTKNIFVNSTFKPRSLAGTQHSGDFQKQNPGILSVCWVLNNVGNEMRRGGGGVVAPLPSSMGCEPHGIALRHPASYYFSGGVCENLIPSDLPQVKQNLRCGE